MYIRQAPPDSLSSAFSPRSNLNPAWSSYSSSLRWRSSSTVCRQLRDEPGIFFLIGSSRLLWITGSPPDNSRSLGENPFSPHPTGEGIRARIVPRCTSFASYPIVAEAMKWKNTVIIPERIAILRRESLRQYTATFCWHPAGRTRPRQSPAARHGRSGGAGSGARRSFPGCRI